MNAHKLDLIQKIVGKNLFVRLLPEQWRLLINIELPSNYRIKSNHELGYVLNVLKRRGMNIRRYRTSIQKIGVNFYEVQK